MKKIAINSLKVLSSVYLILAAYLYFFQHTLLYFPTQEIAHSYTQETFINQNESIKTIVLHPKQKNAIIYFGGNEENIANTAPYFDKHFPNHAVYMLNYRGYSGSSGVPTQNGIFSDALHLYDSIQSKHNSISTVGRSLGSGVAVYLASQKPIEKLGLITPYDSITNVAKERYAFFPIALLIKDPFDSLSYVSKIKSEILVLLAQTDKVVKHKHANNLINALDEQRTSVKTISNTNHSTIITDLTTYNALKKFMEEKKN
ncbi:MAG: alpha/beta hydrolase [Campylobacterota bacterium]|nr:alpha/beta hydrolase [Campylobacterota bacterium]